MSVYVMYLILLLLIPILFVVLICLELISALFLFQVLTSFSLTHVKRPALMESVFQCDVQEGQVSPCSVLKVSVRFTPLTVDSTSVDYFRLSCPGGNSTDVLEVTGSCIGETNYLKFCTHVHFVILSRRVYLQQLFNDIMQVKM